LQNLFFFIATVRVENFCCIEAFREYQRIRIRSFNEKKAKSEINAPESQRGTLQKSRLQGHFGCGGAFGAPVPKPTRTINLLHPPKDVSIEELEGYWGTLDDVKSLRDVMREENILLYPKRKVKPF
jgi:hypothetical protein